MDSAKASCLQSVPKDKERGHPKAPLRFTTRPGFTPPTGRRKLRASELSDLQRRSEAGEELSEDEQQALAEAKQLMERLTERMSRSALARVMDSDPRSVAQYQAEVDAYVARCRQALPKALHDGAAAHLLPLRLRLHNLTQMNLMDVEVVFYVPGQVEGAHPRTGAVAVNDPFVRMPTPPQPHGSARPRSPWENTAIQALRVHPGIAAYPHRPSLPDPYKPHIENGGSVTITLPAGDLRPDQHFELEDIVLIVRAPAPPVIRASWSATCKNLDGTVAGELDLPTGGEPLSVSTLLTEPDICENHRR